MRIFAKKNSEKSRYSNLEQKQINMNTELTQKVISALDQIRPLLQADGGDISFVELTNDNIVKVKLQGACGSCPHAVMTLKNGVEVAVKQAIPEIIAVEAV